MSTAVAKTEPNTREVQPDRELPTKPVQDPSDLSQVSASADCRQLSAKYVLCKELQGKRHAPLDHPDLLLRYQRLRAGTSIVDGAVQLSADAASAKLEIFDRNLRLVWSVARTIAQTYRGPHTVMDLFQIGSHRLWQIIEKFDETRGNKFSTFVVDPIRQRIITEIYQKTDDPIPNEWFRRLKVIEDSIFRIRISGGAHYPSPAEIVNEVRRFYSNKLAHRLGRQPELSELPEMARELTEQKIERIFRMAFRNSVSLSAPTSEEHDSNPLRMEDIVPTKNGHDFANLVQVYSLKLVLEALEQLPKREQEVIRLYFGLTAPDDSEEPKTHREIAQIQISSGTRVGQLKEKALGTLRNILERGIKKPLQVA